MAFTDEDLERLKERLNSPIKSATEDTFPIDLSENDTRALLARLEAAERCLDYMIFEDGKVDGEKLFNAWRKAKGERNDSEASAGR